MLTVALKTLFHLRVKMILLAMICLSALSAAGQQLKDPIIFLNAFARENRLCIVERNNADNSRLCTDDFSDRFLTQGRRMEFRIVNRKFFSDYTITVDGVTQLKQLAIQDLEDAANLQTPTAQPAATPSTKGALLKVVVLEYNNATRRIFCWNLSMKPGLSILLRNSNQIGSWC